VSRLLFPDLAPEDEAAGFLPDLPTLTSAQVLAAVSRRHPMDGFSGRPAHWVFCREVQAATGQYADVQRFDAVAVGLVPSVKYARVIYEIKVSRADWLREMRPIPDVVENFGYGERRMDPRRARRVAAALAVEETPNNALSRTWWKVVGEYRKWDLALSLSTEFWIAAPPRVVQLDELPPEAGLVEVRLWGKDREPRARVVRPAPVRDTPHPGPEFWAAFLRRAAERPA
jgi:hypothetical protein